MKFSTRCDACYYLKTHTAEFQKKLKVVKTRYWSVDNWCWIPCYTVVMK